MKMIEKRPRGRPRALDRDEALETALQLFWRHGYEGTSIADLTAAMGVTPPSLYTAFGSKERLYQEALDRYGASYGSFTARALAEEPTARRAVERILQESVAVYSEGPAPRGCMLASGAVTCAPEHTLVVADLSRRRVATIAAIKARFDRAVIEGELAPSTDTEALAAFYAAVVQGLSIQARDGVERDVLDAVATTALSAWPGEATSDRHPES
ncbi:TetR/AcrR family transcriptional regulator [Chelatococcus asaccharovorans]|uniref:TetR family transcriptional regulator n=1 Tax=Chelatococcus asaccharovorans TaxID=28210 RepID=A0A2V3U3I3_9HYPH|nr:TetR/AcrR family transcriptional regulator [Chelatococcus asaccharovorans]PXW57285.1 TetR family transcriptional regulator [Chelatococcus asaccharovorans]